MKWEGCSIKPYSIDLYCVAFVTLIVFMPLMNVSFNQFNKLAQLL